MMLVQRRCLSRISPYLRGFRPRHLLLSTQSPGSPVSEPPVISLDEFSKRRQSFALKLGQHVNRLSNTFSRHIILFPGSEVQYMAYHVPYRFHQDSNFLYFTGLYEANAILAMDISVQPPLKSKADPQIDCSEYLFVEVRSSQTELWDGPTIGVAGALEATGIQKVYTLHDFREFLKRMNSDTTLWYSPMLRRESTAQVPNRFVLGEVMRLRESCQPKIESPDPLVDTLRYVKSPAEIRMLHHAAKITSQCLMEVIAASHPNVKESTLSNIVEFESRTRGLPLGYPPVVAGGPRANTIHYMKNDKLIRDGELVLMDVGSMYKGYTADVTRTWPVNGYYTPAQRLLHDILEDVQSSCAKAVSPKRNLADIHQVMLTELSRHLVSERIISSTNSMEVVQQICPHSVGHFLGLDVHDTPTISHSQPFEPGVVFPLEPGIYMRPQLIDKYGIQKEFLGLGLRLEDDFVVAPDGSATRLTDQLPTSALDLELLVRRDAKTQRVAPSHTAQLNSNI